MIAFISELFTVLNAATPIAVIALLGVVIYILVYRGGGLKAVQQGQDTLATNHMHELKDCMIKISDELEKLNTNVDLTRHEIVRNQNEIQIAITWMQAKMGNGIKTKVL